MKATGINPETGLVEVVENPDHPGLSGCNITQNTKVRVGTTSAICSLCASSFEKLQH